MSVPANAILLFEGKKHVLMKLKKAPAEPEYWVCARKDDPMGNPYLQQIQRIDIRDKMLGRGAAELFIEVIQTLFDEAQEEPEAQAPELHLVKDE